MVWFVMFDRDGGLPGRATAVPWLPSQVEVCSGGGSGGGGGVVRRVFCSCSSIRIYIQEQTEQFCLIITSLYRVHITNVHVAKSKENTIKYNQMQLIQFSV